MDQNIEKKINSKENWITKRTTKKKEKNPILWSLLNMIFFEGRILQKGLCADQILQFSDENYAFHRTYANIDCIAFPFKHFFISCFAELFSFILNSVA